MTDLTFIDELPAGVRSTVAPSRWTEVMDKLKQHPGQWAIVSLEAGEDSEKVRMSLHSYAWRKNAHVNTRLRDGKLYIRYNGPRNP